MIYHACVDPSLVEECEVFGDGYCPEVDCETEGDTEPYDEDACTNMYCTCTEGMWEEVVSMNMKKTHASLNYFWGAQKSTLLMLLISAFEVLLAYRVIFLPVGV